MRPSEGGRCAPSFDPLEGILLRVGWAINTLERDLGAGVSSCIPREERPCLLTDADFQMMVKSGLLLRGAAGLAGPGSS